MAIPKGKYLDETVMRQAFQNVPYSTHPLIPTIIKALKRRVGSRLLPGCVVPRNIKTDRRGRV